MLYYYGVLLGTIISGSYVCGPRGSKVWRVVTRSAFRTPEGRWGWETSIHEVDEWDRNYTITAPE